MRLHRWIVFPILLAACAQPPVTTTTTTTTATIAPPPREIVNQPVTASPEPANCGTPTAPQSCPPLPKVPLNSYVGDRKGR
jgi:hypothetical protein